MLSRGYSIRYDVICYSESKDGIHWHRPNLGLIEFGGSKQNNIILSGVVANQGFVPFRDDNPDCKPPEQYKAVNAMRTPEGGMGLYAFVSPDGIRWSRLGDKPIISEGYFDSQNLAFWTSVRECYVDFHRVRYAEAQKASVLPPTSVRRRT